LVRNKDYINSQSVSYYWQHKWMTKGNNDDNSYSNRHMMHTLAACFSLSSRWTLRSSSASLFCLLMFRCSISDLLFTQTHIHAPNQ